MKSRTLKQFLLFTAPNASARKLFIASFDNRIDAIERAEKLKGGGPMRWQVIDGLTNQVVAEDPGGD